MTIFDRLIKLIDNVFEGDISTEGIDGKTLLADIGMNSIGYIYMAVAIEEEFGGKLTNDDFAKLKTVGDVVELIENKQ